MLAQHQSIAQAARPSPRRSANKQQGRILPTVLRLCLGLAIVMSGWGLLLVSAFQQSAPL